MRYADCPNTGGPPVVTCTAVLTPHGMLAVLDKIYFYPFASPYKHSLSNVWFPLIQLVSDLAESIFKNKQ
jgi:hypothetical protein